MHKYLMLLLIAFATTANAEEENCPISSFEDPLPLSGEMTKEPSYSLPVPAVENDCGFYNAAWHAFLYATVPTGANKVPAFISYPKLRDVFPMAFTTIMPFEKAIAGQLSLDIQVRNPEPILNVERREPRIIPSVDDGFTQAAKAGLGSVLVDVNGNPVYYSIHVNDVFKRFVADNRLDDIPRHYAPVGSQDAIPVDLEFRPGSVEFKASWMIVEGSKVDLSSYFQIDALVPYLKNVTDQEGKTNVVVDVDRPPRSKRLALLGLHVVEVLDGHPEFVWATFEHVDASGQRNLTPAATANPVDHGSGPVTESLDDATKDYPLFLKNSSIADSNIANPPQVFDDATQKFVRPTPIFRVFPGSGDAPTGDTESPWEDVAVFKLNKAFTERFDIVDPKRQDMRRNYRLVGAIWLDTPRKVDQDLSGNWATHFIENTEFLNSDPRFAGENRLSNVSIESFTQPEAAAPNCFSCHETKSQNLGLGGHVIPARRLNVSHVFDIVVRRYLNTIQGGK